MTQTTQLNPLDREQAFAALDAMCGKRVELFTMEGVLMWGSLTGTLHGPDHGPDPEFPEAEELWRTYCLNIDGGGSMTLAGYMLGSGWWVEDAVGGRTLHLDHKVRSGAWDANVWIEEVSVAATAELRAGPDSEVQP